jgi:hypothetical protein
MLLASALGYAAAAVSQAHVNDEATRATQRASEAAAERYRARWHHVEVLATEREAFVPWLARFVRRTSAGATR